jgi:hypothetical protein
VSNRVAGAESVAQRPERPTLRDVTGDGFVRADAMMESPIGWAIHVAAGALFFPGREVWLLFLNGFSVPTQWMISTGPPTLVQLSTAPDVTHSIAVLPIQVDTVERRVALGDNAGLVLGACRCEDRELFGVVHLLAGAVLRGRRLPWTPNGAAREEPAWGEDAERALELVRRGLGWNEALQELIDAPGGLHLAGTDG